MGYLYQIVKVRIKALIKAYLKKLTRCEREKRIVFLGRRLKIKQYRWLHFNTHPWEVEKKESEEQE